MMITMTQEDLEDLKEISLHHYNNENVLNLSSEAFWGKAVLLGIQEILKRKGVELQVEYPSTYPYQIKS